MKIIRLSNKCSAKCKYCMKELNDDINPNEIYENLKEDKNIRIICFDSEVGRKQLKILLNANNLFDNIEIVSNGVDLTESLVELINNTEKVSKVIFLVDGNYFSNSLRLTDKGHNTLDSVLFYSSRIKEKKLGCHIIIHPYNVAWMHKTVFFLKNKGFTFFNIEVLNNNDLINKSFIDRFISEADLISKDIKEGKINNINIFEEYKPREYTSCYDNKYETCSVIENLLELVYIKHNKG